MQGEVRAPAQQAVALVFVGLAGFKGGDERLQTAVVGGDDNIGAEEDINFAGAGELVARVPEREVQDGEEVAFGLVELGAFDMAAAVLKVERVEVWEAAVEGGNVGGARLDDVDPGGVVVRDFACAHGA